MQALRLAPFQTAHTITDDRIQNIVEQTRAFPEYVRGDSDTTIKMNDKIVTLWDEHHQRINKLEQPPQLIQAWSVAAVLELEYSNTKSDKNILTTMPVSELERTILQTI